MSTFGVAVMATVIGAWVGIPTALVAAAIAGDRRDRRAILMPCRCPCAGPDELTALARTVGVYSDGTAPAEPLPPPTPHRHRAAGPIVVDSGLDADTVQLPGWRWPAPR